MEWVVTGDGGKQVGNKPPLYFYDVLGATLGLLVHPYESYSLQYMVNHMVFKVIHMVQGLQHGSWSTTGLSRLFYC